MKSRTLLYHSIFWAGIYLLWILVFRSYSFSITKTMTVEFCYLLFVTADFYAINDLFVPQFLHKKRYPVFVAATITIIALSAWLRALVAVQMNRHIFHVAPVDFGALYLNSFINISIWVSVLTIVKMFIDRIRIQRQLELLEKESIKSELDYLKAQINPHALLNSLNTIYGHIDKSNQTARDVLLQFSELLKYQLYECGAEKVDLQKEIAYINNYVAFQRLRKSDNLVVHIETGDITPGLQIAPLLMIVLVENAFKFVSSFPDKENKISISISAKENIVNCRILNTKEIQQPVINANPGGIGFANLKRRLELLYGQKYALGVKAGHDFYETNLTIDLS